MTQTVDRLFALKIVTYATQRKDFAAPDLAKILRRAKRHNLPVKDKHHPAVGSMQKGRRAAFINKITDLGAHGVIVEVCSYLHGVFPETGTVPFNQEEIDLDAAQKAVTPSRGSQEALYRFRALIFGQSVIVEKAGNTNGVGVLPHVLRRVLRTVLNDETFPLPHLVNVGSRKLASIVKSKGGVDKVVANLIVPKRQPKHKFASLLSAVRKSMRGAEEIQVAWTSKNGDLGASDVEAIYEEFEDDEVLDSVKISFPGGASVTDLSRYREQERFPVQVDSNNRPYSASVHQALRDYSARLRDPLGNGPLTPTGELSSGYYLAGSDDED